MTANASHEVLSKLITSSVELSLLVKTLKGLPNNPPSLYLSANQRSLTIYVTPTRTINKIDLEYLAAALDRGDDNASALKDVLETSAVIKVFFDARMPSKTLFDRCSIQLRNPPSYERAHIHEVQIMEVAVRKSEYGRERLSKFDNCIARDSTLDDDMPISDNLNAMKHFDTRILHLPVLWKKYHALLVAGGFWVGGPFWVARIRAETERRLAVSRGEVHAGYSIDGSRTTWDEETITELLDDWNEDVTMDAFTHGEMMGGAEYWSKFQDL